MDIFACPPYASLAITRGGQVNGKQTESIYLLAHPTPLPHIIGALRLDFHWSVNSKYSGEPNTPYHYHLFACPPYTCEGSCPIFFQKRSLFFIWLQRTQIIY